MNTAALDRVEFFAKRDLRRELSIGLLIPVCAAVYYRTSFTRDIVAVLLGSALGVWLQRRRPILVIDGDWIRLPWNWLGEKDLARRKIQAWCWTRDGKRLAFHLHSKHARVIDVSTLSLEERSAITHALAERGYVETQPGQLELAAIQTERILQRLRPLGWFIIPLFALAAVMASLGSRS